MVPKRYGGWQADIRTKLEVTREVAEGCGSTAWVTALMNVCSFFVALMNEQAQDDVWGANPDARIAGVFNPTAQTRKVDGGIIVTGAWNWASGCVPRRLVVPRRTDHQRGRRVPATRRWR